MKRITGFFFLFCFLNAILSQNVTGVFYKMCNPCEENNYAYESGFHEFSINQITSNFDRRDCQSCLAAWHNAIDYSAKLDDKDRGYKIKSIEQDGIVKDIYVSGSNKGVGVLIGKNFVEPGGFFYYHLFKDSNYPVSCQVGLQQGSFVLKFMDSPNSANYAILDLDTNVAIGSIEGDVSFNGVTYQVYNDFKKIKDILGQNYINSIGPMGDSNTGDNNVHLHLQYVHSYCKNCGGYFNNSHLDETSNPLKYLPLHTSLVKSSNISIKKYASGGPLSYPNGISINYPGTKSSSIMAQVELDNESSGSTYLNHTAAIEEVQFLGANISQGQNKHTLFAGMDIGESKLLIGGNPNLKQRYPLSISDNGTIGSFSTGTVNGITGMSAFAYSGQDFDQYFFSDIYTRRYNLHNSKNNYQSEFADFSNDATLSDGIWSFKVRARDIRDKIIESNPIEISVDNFLPYIKTAAVESYNFLMHKPIYLRSWVEHDPGYSHIVANDGILESSAGFNGKDYNYSTYYTVNAETSESMDGLSCNIKELQKPLVVGKPVNNEKTKWEFELSGYNLVDGHDYTLHFEGTDKSGNKLLKTHELATQAKEQPIKNPVRINQSGSNQWEPSSNAKTGFDEYHILKIKKGCGKFFKGANEVRGGDCFSAAFTYKVLPDGISVQFTNQSEGNPSSYIWEFGDGASSTEENPTHEYYGTGKYKVKLTAYLNGETDEVEHIVDLSLLAQNGNFVVNIIGSSSVGLGSVQNYMSEVVGGYPPYSYNWDVNKDFSLSTCPGFYSVRYTDEFEVEFTSPGCNLGNEGQISLEVTDAEGNVAIGTLDVSIIGESPECKIVYSGELKPNKFVNLKIEKKDFLFGANCKTYYTFFDWEISGPGYYDDSNKNISYWLPYEFPKNGVYTVTAKGKLGMYDWPLDEYVTTIIINDGIPPAPPNPPFSFYPSNTINVDFGESLSANKNNNFFMGLLYKNPLDQDNNTTCNEKTFDATGYRYDISIKTPGTGNFYQAAFGLNDFGSKGGDVIGNIFAFHDPGAINSDPVNLTINQDFYGCNDITIEVYPQGLTCDASIINCENGQKSACTTNLINDPKAYIWSECLTCPKPPFASGTFENYKYSLPIKIEKKCAFKFDPPQLIVNPAVVNTMDCGQTYLQVVVEGGATFTTGNNTPGGFPCAGSPQAYKTYEWSCFTMDGTIPIDVLKKGNSQCVEVNYDSKYFDTFWNETEVSFKVILKVWDRLDDYAIREFYVTVNKPMRLEIPTERNVCGGSSIVFNNGFPLLSGGSGDFTYFWDKTQYFNDNFNASSPSPQLDLPDLPNGSVIYTLLVTDNISGCTLSKKITINFGSIIVNAGPDIITCIGQSLKKLGLLENEVMVSGGDGNYTYAWNSSIGFDNLSDPQSLRPTVSAVDNIPVSYYLEVHDGSGCYATDEVVVTGGHDLNFKAEAGLDQTVCYGSNVQILGKSFSGVTYKWKVSPTQTLKTDNEAELSLTESFTTNPGTYILNYTLADDIGCYSQDEMMLTVANQWKYIGFEPGISYIIPPFILGGRIFDRVKPNLTKLPKIYTVADNNGSGALAPFTYSWLEPGVESKITQNSKVISQDGYLQEANIVNPPESGYTMKVTDALGCTMNFHTNYFLLHAGQKSLEVTSLSGDYYLCNEAKLQFKVIYKTGYTGMLPTKLPQKLSVKFDVQNWLKTNQTGDGGQFYQQGEVSTALLTLTNSKEGIYEGIITLNKNLYSFNEYYSDCGYQATHFYKMIVTATQPILNTVEVKFDVYNSSNIPLINCLSTTTITGPCSIPRRVWGRKVVAIGYASTCNAGSLRVINGGQCDVRVGSAFTDPEGIYLRNIIEVEEGSYFHAYIEPLCSGQAYKPIKDPVIVDEPYPLSNDVPQVYHKDGLLFPNPTKGLIYLKQNYGETRSSLIIAICVYDVMGQKLIKSTKSYDWSQPIEFDVSTLKSGAYFIEINSSLGEVFRFNFIKIDN